MLRRIAVFILLATLAFTVACTNKKVNNPLANVGSKQPDKVLFDRAMDAMKHNRFDVARITLQTLINTYPDSEYIARAKLAVADSWYAEGGSTSLAQAEAEYKDFETFFPNMPEAAEAQVKIANIHYQQMEKPDRDFTHAMRAEEEYRQVILQYPDNKKMVAEAKQRLLEVQEVIAEREYRVGRFYYLRESYPAAIARLQSLANKYPLYSKADEALFLLGQSYEGEITMVRAKKFAEVSKARMIQDLTKSAAEAYSRILTRYPLMDRVDDAKARLQALHQPVPRPTKQAIALNKREEESRRETPMYKQVIRNFSKRPDTEQAAKGGDPTLVDPPMTSATEVVQQATRAMMGTGGGADKNAVAIETVEPENSAAPPAEQPANELKPNVATDSNELKPNTPSDSNELKPNVSDNSGQTLPPPQQVNEIQPGQASQPADAQAGAKPGDSASSSSTQQKDDDETISSSKKKKKKGLKKIVPF